MAVLGKRKAAEPAISQEEADAIFRKHFEAQFAPLDSEPSAAAKKKKSRQPTASGADSDKSDDDAAEQSSENDENAESEWGGLSDDEGSYDVSDGDEDDEEVPVVEVIDHSASQTSKPEAMSKRELKAFMSSRPPDQNSKTDPQPQPTTASSKSNTLPEDAPSLLANDLELRRLLSESHLLSSPALTSGSGGVEPRPFASGRVRQRTTDLRTQSLGSKSSILKQENMPMYMRKGINAAAEARESKRRREAKENGIILERPAAANGKRKGSKGRDFGLDRPGVGRLKGAELRLSDRDVKSIENSRDTFGRKGRGGKRR